jgi:hypothetical protein
MSFSQDTSVITHDYISMKHSRAVMRVLDMCLDIYETLRPVPRGSRRTVQVVGCGMDLTKNILLGIVNGMGQKTPVKLAEEPEPERSFASTTFYHENRLGAFFSRSDRVFMRQFTTDHVILEFTDRTLRYTNAFGGECVVECIPMGAVGMMCDYAIVSWPEAPYTPNFDVLVSKILDPFTKEHRTTPVRIFFDTPNATLTQFARVRGMTVGEATQPCS